MKFFKQFAPVEIISFALAIFLLSAIFIKYFPAKPAPVKVAVQEVKPQGTYTNYADEQLEKLRNCKRIKDCDELAAKLRKEGILKF